MPFGEVRCSRSRKSCGLWLAGVDKHAERAELELVSDRSEGPYAGVHRFEAPEFIVRRVDHVPERYEVRARYAGAYAHPAVWWRRRGVVVAGASSEPRSPPERDHAWPAFGAVGRATSEAATHAQLCSDMSGSVARAGASTRTEGRMGLLRLSSAMPSRRASTTPAASR